ncbi:uncharacterized protein V6R79_002331 [Siganus canaliculatus]
MEDILDLEVKAKVIWTSVTTGREQLMASKTYRDSAYCGVYTKLWEFPEGERVSTAHLLDGRFVSIGPRLPAPRQLKKADASTQTTTVDWYWDALVQNITAPGAEADDFMNDVLPKISTTRSLSVPDMPVRNPTPQLDLDSRILALKNRITELEKIIEEQQNEAPTLASAHSIGDDVEMASVPSVPPVATPDLGDLLVLDAWVASPPTPNPNGTAMEDDSNRDPTPPSKASLSPALIEDGVLTLQVDDEDDDFLVMRT